MAVYRLDWGGSLYKDVWQCRIHLNGEIDQDLDLLDEVEVEPVLADIEGDLKRWWTALTPTMSSTLEWLKLNELDPDTGRYVSQTTTVGRDWDPVPGPGAMKLAPQVSLATSWETGVRRGRAAKGRIYPPPTTTTFDATGQVQEAEREKTANAGAQLISDLNNWPGIDAVTDLTCIVLSTGSADYAAKHNDPGWLTHVKRNITSVRVGSVLDTQRRRRSALRETYTVAQLS